MPRLAWILAGFFLLGSCNNFSGNYLRPGYGVAIPDSAIGRLQDVATVMPQNAPSISQGFMPAPALRYKRDSLAIHNGIDIVARRGTPVYAAATGTIRLSLFEPVYGHRVEVEHPADSRGYRYRSRYFHLRKRLVAAGDRVTPDQPIGELGSSGLMAAFPHLHFEISVLPPGSADWQPVNPHAYWLEGPGRVTCWEPGIKAMPGKFHISYPLDCRDSVARRDASAN